MSMLAISALSFWGALSFPKTDLHFSGSCASRILDAWIERGVSEIDQEVDRYRDHGDEHHQVLNDRVVAPADRLDQEACDARDVEYRLSDDQAAHQEGRLDADNGDHRQRRVAQRMVEVDVVVGGALGTGGANVVLPQHLK